jgi:hypothetical protein
MKGVIKSALEMIAFMLPALLPSKHGRILLCSSYYVAHLFKLQKKYSDYFSE